MCLSCVIDADLLLLLGERSEPHLDKFNEKKSVCLSNLSLP